LGARRRALLAIDRLADREPIGSQMVRRVLALPEGPGSIFCAVLRAARGESLKSSPVLKKGFQRVKIDGTFYEPRKQAGFSDKNSRMTSTWWWTAS